MKKQCRNPSVFDWHDITEIKVGDRTIGDIVSDFYKGARRPKQVAPGESSHIEIRVEPHTGLVCSFKIDGIELGKTSLSEINFSKKAGEFPTVTATFISNDIVIDVPLAEECTAKTVVGEQPQYQRSWRGTPKSEKVRKILTKSRRGWY